jgi:Beta-galactosidase/beta-glucuronidase
MKLRKITIGLAVFLSLTGTAAAQVLMPSKGLGKQISLNGVWKFKYFPSSNVGGDESFFEPTTDVTRWANIKTPGHWELQGFAEPFYGKELKEGTGLYRTAFTVPADWKGEPVYIAFDGVQYGYRFWVNGKYVGSFNSSFNRQTYDISSFVTPGKENVLAVRVTTRSKGWEFDTNDCWSLSGIIRDVTLFSLPTTHIKDLVVKTFVGKSDATLSVSAQVEKMKGGKLSKKTTVTASLFAPDGKLVKEFSLSPNKPVADSVSFSQQVKIDAPSLWTAETPNLYKLTVSLKNNGKEIQKRVEKIGIREVTWDNGVLKLNGKPIKLRGVNHHDLSPVNGRSVTEAEMLQDLKLIREANINYIRTSHYAPQPRFIELCDSLGFYVMEEVPFGFGDNHLNDKTYLPILKERAKATVWRDKNHPSIIVWSVGNENPLTPMCVETGEYVKQLDPTRPHCFPQIGSYFRKTYETIPASVDILSPHYTAPSALREYSTKFDRPMIVTEYAHALGLDFDRVEALWEIMYANPKLAGGSVWHFFDQGILRKSTEKTVPGTFTTSVWLDSVTVYDNSGNQGADGLVYANRVPQVDYWQLRKVYTPVKLMDDTLHVLSGKQTVSLKVNNRYDFTNLAETQCRWSLYADTTLLQSGISSLACAPHDTTILSLAINVPEKATANYYHLKVQFSDKQGYTFYEKVYPLQVKNNTADFRQQLASKATKPVLKANTISCGNFTLALNPQTGMIQLSNSSGAKLIADGPYARMGRKTTMSEQATTNKPVEKKSANIDDPLMTEKAAAESNPIWTPHLLNRPQIKVESLTAKQMVVNYTYERENGKGQFIAGKVIYTVSDSGRIDVQYRFVPNRAKGVALEAGISFLLPASLTEFRWVGKGPYPAYPGKNRLDELGIYHLNSTDLNYQGNREDVDLAVLSDAQGNGIAIVADKADIAVENSAQGIVVSHNAFVSGRFNKGSMPEQKVNVEKLKEISGRFSIVPLNGNWPSVLTNLFGLSTKVAKPFVPFYNSYDQ